MAKKRQLKLNVLGKNCDSKKANIAKAVEPMLKIIGLSQRMINGLSIRVEIRATKLKGTTIGCAFIHPNGSQTAKDFRIIVHRELSTIEMYKTLAHELIHIAQKATNKYQVRRWKSDKKYHARWDGEEVGAVENIPYLTRPWEVEAYAEAPKVSRKYRIGR